MNRNILHLKNIIQYCDSIEEANHKFGTEEDFLNKIQFQYSCAFSLIMIGENVKRLSPDIKSKYLESDWNKFDKLGDIISYEYQDIDLRMVWKTIRDDISPLKKECESILSHIESFSEL